MRGHQAVLSWASSVLRLLDLFNNETACENVFKYIFRRLLMSSLLLEDGGKRKEEVHFKLGTISSLAFFHLQATFLLPDVSTEAVTFLLSFLLTGVLHIR